METSHEGGTNQMTGAPSQSDAHPPVAHPGDNQHDSANAGISTAQSHSSDRLSDSSSQPSHLTHDTLKRIPDVANDQPTSELSQNSTSTGMQSTDSTHKTLHPDQNFMQEIKDNPPETHKMAAAQPATAPPIPTVFNEASANEAPNTETVSTSAEAAIASQMNQPTNAIPAPAPSGRWQTFWYALSVLTLGILVIDAATATSWGTLNKLLVGFKANPADHLFGTRFDIITANTLLGSLLVCLPIFIIATIKVDRYLIAHPKLPTASMKKIAYFVLVIVALVIIGDLGSAIFQALNYTFDVVTGVSILVDILFAAGFGFWLYTTVAEDRKE